MKILIFGATGMVGQGVLRECLLDPGVELVQTIGRTATGVRDVKLCEIVHADMWNYDSIEGQLTGFDACFFCLGVSVMDVKEEEYRRITHDLPIAAAEALSRLNPGMTFVHVSATGADSTELGSQMWARVKGKTENDLMRLPFKAVYVLRPGVIQPLHGARSRTRMYRIAYALLRPVLSLLRRIFPNKITTTEEIGRAMLKLAREGGPGRVMEKEDIIAAGRVI